MRRRGPGPDPRASPYKPGPAGQFIEDQSPVRLKARRGSFFVEGLVSEPWGLKTREPYRAVGTSLAVSRWGGARLVDKRGAQWFVVTATHAGSCCARRSNDRKS